MWRVMARKQGTIHALRINAAQVLTPRSAFVIFLFIRKPSLYIFHNWPESRDPATPPPVFHSPLPHILNVAVIYRCLAAVIVTIFQLFDNNAKLNRSGADQTAIFIVDYPRNNANFPPLVDPLLLPPPHLEYGIKINYPVFYNFAILLLLLF